MGRIADQTRSILPVTWDALLTDSRIGDTVLTARLDYAQSFILGAVQTTPQEDALDPLVVEFVAKFAATQIIDTAIDFWMDTSITRTTTGTSEVVSYESRINALKELKGNLIKELAELAGLVEPLIPVQVQRRQRPLLSTINDELLTPDPQQFGRPYAIPQV
jgi:hypothetical protein